MRRPVETRHCCAAGGLGISGAVVSRRAVWFTVFVLVSDANGSDVEPASTPDRVQGQRRWRQGPLTWKSATAETKKRVILKIIHSVRLSLIISVLFVSANPKPNQKVTRLCDVDTRSELSCVPQPWHALQHTARVRRLGGVGSKFGCFLMMCSMAQHKYEHSTVKRKLFILLCYLAVLSLDHICAITGIVIFMLMLVLARPYRVNKVQSWARKSQMLLPAIFRHSRDCQNKPPGQQCARLHRMTKCLFMYNTITPHNIL